MKKVSLRDFQLKASNYINELPIALTRYGSIIAIIRKPEPRNHMKENK